MSEEDYYIDILNNDEDEDPKRKKDQQWGPQSYPPQQQAEQPRQQYYQEDRNSRPYKQEFYAEGYYQDYQANGRPPMQRRKKEERPWFWIGFLIAVGFSAIIMVIFNFIGTSSHPGLAYVELVLLMICAIIPGLFVRKVGKGILGGLMVFALQFFIPLIVFYATGQNPHALFSPYFLFLNALGLIKMGVEDVLGFSFIPITPEIMDYYNQYSGYVTFVWIFDLLIMFSLIITLIIASSWLFSNILTKKARSFWSWCVLPGQALVIIVNLFIVPYILLSMSSTVQIGGALAAGGANLGDIVTPFATGNTSLEGLDTEAILASLDRADFWFDIAKDNYFGLNKLMFMSLMEKISGRYAIIPHIFNSTIYAGFELLAALQPLGHGFFDNSNSSDVEVDGFYFQYQNFMQVYDVFGGMFNMSGGLKPSETDLSNAESTVNVIIDDVDYL
ncbi:MAG: hypothetical protein ACFFDW_11995, partial [Candidatus Thorarchaeota archaeon]